VLASAALMRLHRAPRLDLAALVARAGEIGAELTVEAPGIAAQKVGARPERTRVVFRTRPALDAMLRGDHLALAEAFLRGDVDVEGDLGQVFFVTDWLDLRQRPLDRVGFWLRLLLDRRRFHRESIAFHYDRPPAFFLGWLDASACYTHGFYASADTPLETAIARKLAFAVDALGLAPGMRVLDVGCGWGAFLDYAGARGIAVHGITISRAQHDHVSDRIRARGLPCTVELVDFVDYRPAHRFDAAVFMGSLEHMPDYRRLVRFLQRHLEADGRVYADFVTSREGRLAGAFLRKYIFPGVSGYVDLGGVVGALHQAGFHVVELGDDTLDCANTVRDWALRLERVRAELATCFGEPVVRAFLLYLWGSHYFLEHDRTQAYHLVAARGPGALRRPPPAHPCETS
jgi:cyclopropane-fatty-acyl-phospholipid synthase